MNDRIIRFVAEEAPMPRDSAYSHILYLLIQSMKPQSGREREVESNIQNRNTGTTQSHCKRTSEKVRQRGAGNANMARALLSACRTWGVILPVSTATSSDCFR